MTSSGLATAAWKEGNVLYALVVEGGQQEYQHFVRPSGAMASL
jgi:hypothetical protein